MTVIDQDDGLALSKLLDVNSISADMTSTDRWDAIDELVDLLVDAGHVSKKNRDAVSGVVKARETVSSTGIGHGVGIPHAQTAFVDRVVSAFGRSSRGIDFESLDGESVKLVILTLIPQGQFQKHLRTLAGMARLLSDETLRAELEKAKSASAILEILRKKTA